MSPATPLYLLGNGFVHRRDGARLSRPECERIQRYLTNRLAETGWSDTLMDGWAVSLSCLSAAMAASFTEQQQAAE